MLAGLIVGILLFMSIIIHGQNILRGVLEEKTTTRRRSRHLERQARDAARRQGSRRRRGGTDAAGSVARHRSVPLLFIIPIVLKGLGPAAHDAAAGPSPLAGALGGISLAVVGVALAFFLVGFTFYAALYAAAGSMVNSEQEAQQAAVPVMLLIMSAWLMVNPVMINPNSRLAVVMSWLPWSSPIIMPMRMGLTSVSPLEVGGSILVAILGSVGAVWLSARIYRVGMLMYGKKPSFAEVAKWIRYA